MIRPSIRDYQKVITNLEQENKELKNEVEKWKNHAEHWENQLNIIKSNSSINDNNNSENKTKIKNEIFNKIETYLIEVNRQLDENNKVDHLSSKNSIYNYFVNFLKFLFETFDFNNLNQFKNDIIDKLNALNEDTTTRVRVEFKEIMENELIQLQNRCNLLEQKFIEQTKLIKYLVTKFQCNVNTVKNNMKSETNSDNGDDDVEIESAFDEILNVINSSINTLPQKNEDNNVSNCIISSAFKTKTKSVDDYKSESDLDSVTSKLSKISYLCNCKLKFNDENQFEEHLKKCNDLI